MAKLHHHRDDGTSWYYTERFEDGLVTRRIHPDGVVFLKRRGVQLNDDIPPFTMSEIVRQGWLFTPEEAASRPDVDWSLEWDSIPDPPSLRETLVNEPSGWKRFEPIDRSSSALPIVAQSTRLPTWSIALLLAAMVAVALLGLNLG